MGRRILLVGPINDQGKGGRFEEMRLWGKFLLELENEVVVFSMFNSHFPIENATMIESAILNWPRIWSNFPYLRKFILRVWGSRIFKSKRDLFYESGVWKDFASTFDHILLFITHQSKEMSIFNLTIPATQSIRFTGTIHDFSVLNHQVNYPFLLKRNYVFHSPSLSKGLETTVTKYFIDQTTLAENQLLQIPLSGSFNIFAMIGLFMEVKQIEKVIHLFREFPSYKLILFGSGALQANFEKSIEEQKLTNVKIAGFFPPSRIDEVYAQIDCLIINSNEETGPMTGTEAMAAGKLILSRPVGAMSDRVEGLDLIYDSIADLRFKIKELEKKSDRELLQIKRTLRERYLERYSNKKLKAEIKSLIDQ